MSQNQTVLVSGASGLIGSELTSLLRERGHVVRTLSRRSGDVHWDIQQGTLDSAALEGVDAVVHLAGEPIAQRWSEAAKQNILKSRVEGTRILAEAVAKQTPQPAFICASGANFYGYQPAGFVDEDSPSGEGFLAEVCRAWEGAAQPAIEAGARTVFMRTGIVLSAKGGALAKMLLPFKFGVGGRIGNGNQRMSWISLPDLARAYVFAVEHASVSGAFNAVSPQPVTNSVFTKTLGHVLGRPTILPLPAPVLTTLFGEMGKETVLADIAVLPARLESRGFEWRQPELKLALEQAIVPS